MAKTFIQRHKKRRKLKLEELRSLILVKVPGITGGVCKSAKRHLVYIDNLCEIIIIIF